MFWRLWCLRFDHRFDLVFAKIMKYNYFLLHIYCIHYIAKGMWHLIDHTDMLFLKNKVFPLHIWLWLIGFVPSAIRVRSDTHIKQTGLGCSQSSSLFQNISWVEFSALCKSLRFSHTNHCKLKGLYGPYFVVHRGILMIDEVWTS